MGRRQQGVAQTRDGTVALRAFLERCSRGGFLRGWMGPFPFRRNPLHAGFLRVCPWRFRLDDENRRRLIRDGGCLPVGVLAARTPDIGRDAGPESRANKSAGMGPQRKIIAGDRTIVAGRAANRSRNARSRRHRQSIRRDAAKGRGVALERSA